MQASAQHIACCREKLFALDQQTYQLPLRDADAEAGQQIEQAWDGVLALMILGEHEAFQLGSEMAGDPCGQRRQHGPAVGQFPALPAIECGARFDDDILDDKILEDFEAGAGRNGLGLDDLGLGDDELRALGPAPTDFALALASKLRRFLHATRLQLWPAVQALQPRNLVAQLRVLCLEPGIILEHLHDQRLQFIEAKSINGAG